MTNDPPSSGQQTGGINRGHAHTQIDHPFPRGNATLAPEVGVAPDTVRLDLILENRSTMYDSSTNTVNASWKTSPQGPPSRSGRRNATSSPHVAPRPGIFPPMGRHAAHALQSDVVNGPSAYPREKLTPRTRPQVGSHPGKPPRQDLVLKYRWNHV